MKKKIFTSILTMILLYATSVSASTTLAYRTFDELGLISGTGFCTVQQSIIAYNFYQEASYYRFDDAASMQYTTYELDGCVDGELMIGGEALYVLDQAGNLQQVGSDSPYTLLGTIDRTQMEEAPCKGFLCAQRWLVLMTDALTLGDLPSRKVYICDMEQNSSISIDKEYIIDVCLYREDQCLLLCYENDAYVLYTYVFASGSLVKYEVLGAEEVACITYYEPEDKIYFVKASSLWCQQKSDPPHQEGFTPWQQLRYDVFAFTTEAGVLGLYTNDEIILYALMQEAAPSAPLTIACPQLQNYCKAALTSYRRAHSEIEIQMKDIDTSSAEDYLQLLYKDASLDVIAVDNMELLEILMDKGYCADLSGSSTISETISGMAPALAAPISCGEAIYAIPYMASFAKTIPGYNPVALQKLGLSEAELPTTWEAFFDFVEAWADQPSLEENELTLIRSPYSLYDLRETIFLAITEQQLAQCEQQGIAIMLDTPVIRHLLTRLDEISDLLSEIEESNANRMEYTDDGQNAALFILDYEPIVSDGESAVNSGCTILPLRIAADSEPWYPIHQSYIIISRASQHQQEALQLLETIVTHLEQKTEMMLFPGKRMPIEASSYQKNLGAYEAWKSSFEQALQACTDDAAYQQLLSRYNTEQEEWDFTLKSRYKVTPDSVQRLQAMDQQMVPSRGYHFFFQQSNIRAYYRQYMDRQISASQFIDAAERVLHLQQLEHTKK